MQLLAAIVLAYWSWIVIQTILNLSLVPKLGRGLPDRPPLVSVIIPARNEARSIGGTVEAMLEQTYGHLEVIVVNDRSTDATGDILDAVAGRDQRLTVVHGEDTPTGWLGKPWALHQGAERARGALFLFVDADIHYERDAVGAMVAEMERRSVPFLSVLPTIVMRGFWENALMPQLGVTALSLLPAWLANRTRSRHLALGGGPGNLVAREAYQTAGGHVALRDAVIDDIGLARLVRKAGFRTEFVRADGLVSVRMYHGLREIIDGFTKNTFAVFGRRYTVAILAMLASGVINLLPYVLALTGNLLGILTVGVITLARLILFANIGYRLDNAILLHPVMSLGWGYIFLRSLWLTGVRGRLMWRGRSYDAAKTRFGADDDR